MLTYLTTPVRTMLLAAALACPVQMSEARDAPAQAQTTTARTTARTKTDADTTATDRDGVPVGGILIVIGIVGGVIFFAWVCSRIGDNNRPTMMV
jgi:hypothetical protein